MSFTSEVIKKAEETTQEEKRKELNPKFDNQKNFFEHVDDNINMGVEYCPFLNSLKELYNNPLCPFEYQSDPKGQYKLSDSEVLILQKINDFEAKFLQEIKFGDLYKSTKIVLSKEPTDNDDILGKYDYARIPHYNDIYCPVVKIFMDRVEAVAQKLKCERKYVTASVYLHEMMQRYYDIRPELRWKDSVREIEKPMVVFGVMKFCEDFGDRTMLNISRLLTENLTDSRWYKQFGYYVYILGLKMYESGVDTGLINTYRHVSLMMHNPKSKDINSANPIVSYLSDCEEKKDSLENLVDPIQETIRKFAYIFPQDKGTQ